MLLVLHFSSLNTNPQLKTSSSVQRAYLPPFQNLIIHIWIIFQHNFYEMLCFLKSFFFSKTQVCYLLPKNSTISVVVLQVIVNCIGFGITMACFRILIQLISYVNLGRSQSLSETQFFSLVKNHNTSPLGIMAPIDCRDSSHSTRHCFHGEEGGSGVYVASL